MSVDQRRISKSGDDNKDNNKITKHRAIFQRERQNSYVNRQDQSPTRKLGKRQWPWLDTDISKEMVCWIRFYRAKPPASITVKKFRLSL